MPSNLSPREALDRIAALCNDDRWPNSPLAAELRAVLAEVSPEPGGDIRDRHHGHPFEVVIPCMTLEEANAEKADLHAAVEARAFIRPAGAGGVLDRDQAHDVLKVVPTGTAANTEYLLDRLAACVRPAAIDRDAAHAVLLDLMMATTGHADALGGFDIYLDRILALVRPVAGVTLTPEEARFAADVLAASAAGRVLWPDRLNDDAEALAARLEAGVAS